MTTACVSQRIHLSLLGGNCPHNGPAGEIGRAPLNVLLFGGTHNLSIPQSQHTMNFGWFTDETDESEFSGTTIHEFGHALGCVHEHQSPGANIPWNRELVYSYYQFSNGWSREEVDANILNQYSAASTRYGQSDARPVMLYEIPFLLTTMG